LPNAKWEILQPVTFWCDDDDDEEEEEEEEDDAICWTSTNQTSS
jgi:hypothetical protein